MPASHRIAKTGAAPPRRSARAEDAAARIGNRSTGALLSHMSRLAREPESGLRVRPSDDRFEREAHRIADAPRGRREGPPRISGDPGRASGGRPLDGETSRAIERGRGGGSPLAARIRKTLEPELGGVDLSAIRIQTGARARTLTDAVGARAMTVGRTIWMGEPGWSPDTRSGRETLRHEVVHAMQQSGVRRGPGRRATLGTPSAPTVQCLMTSAQLKLFGGSAGASIRGGKRYQKILDKLDRYHRSRNDTDRARRLTKIGLACDAFIAANTTSDDPVKERKLTAVQDLKEQVEFEQGTRTATSSWEALTTQRGLTRDQGIAGLPTTATTGTKYKFTMWSHIGHRRYTAFAKERAGLRRNDKMVKFFGRQGKTNTEMKREAATTVADRYASDWRVDTASEQEQRRARSNYIDTLIRSSGSVGHAWVSFHTQAADGTDSAKESFGFWPLIAANGFGVDTPGNVKHPDNQYETSGNTRSKTLDVSLGQWKRGLTKCYNVLKSPPMYELTGTNCTTFTRDIARAVGVRFPSAYWVAPDLSSVWNPNDLYDTFDP